jgi:Flp pilus assembly protein TadD
MNGNYDLCEAANRKALALNAGDSYAKKGLGLALYRQGKHEEGLNLIRQIVLDSQYKDQDAVDDLAALYTERGETEKARQLRANQG